MGYTGRVIDPASASPRLDLRLVFGRSAAFSPGKAELLARIAETGSIATAGRAMEMSYKRAWQLVDSMNRCFRVPLVEESKRGRSGEGARLTPTGAEVLARYRRLEARAAEACAKDLSALARIAASRTPER